MGDEAVDQNRYHTFKVNAIEEALPYHYYVIVTVDKSNLKAYMYMYV